MIKYVEMMLAIVRALEGMNVTGYKNMKTLCTCIEALEKLAQEMKETASATVEQLGGDPK